MARVYDALAWLYSGGQIAALKRRQISRLQPGSSVLYAGAGTGGELAAALEMGVQLHALDASSAMLARARRRLGAQAERVTLHCEDLFAHRPTRPYDTVVANFFLNVFSPPQLEPVFERLHALLCPGGELWVGDFAPPVLGRVEGMLQRGYYLPPLFLFHWLTNNPLHPLYDYRPLARARGFQLAHHEPLRIFKWGPAWLSTLTFVKGDHASV